MTLQKFKEKLKSLEDSGIVDDSTQVCGFDVSFRELYALDDSSEILLDVSKCIDSLEAEAKFYGNGMPDRAEKKRKQIEHLQKFGSKAVCLVLTT